MTRKRTIASTIAVVLVVVLAGCGGGGGGGGDGATSNGGDGAAANGGSGGNGGSGSSAVCPQQGSMSWTNPQTGEQVTMNVQGTTMRDGQEVCHATWQTNQDGGGTVAQVEMFFTEDGSYQEFVMYDSDGNVIYEGSSSDGGSGSMDGGGGMDGSGDGSMAGEFCPAGQSIQSANPQTGETASFEVEGIVSHNGRQVCKAVWTTSTDSEGSIATIEYYYTEDNSYVHYIYYDSDGNVIVDQEITEQG